MLMLVFWILYSLFMVTALAKLAVQAHHIVQKRRQIPVKKAPLPVNYWKIARLEIELLGETKLNYDSPIPSGCRNEAEIHGIDETGHVKDGSCNLNCTLGPVCSKSTHRVVRKARDYQRSRVTDEATMTTLGQIVSGAINPYADWTDEDGRPW